MLAMSSDNQNTVKRGSTSTSATNKTTVESASLRDSNLSPPPKSSRESSPRIQTKKALKTPSAKESREPSPARTGSSASLSRLEVLTGSRSTPALQQTISQNALQPVSPRPHRPAASNIPHWPTSPRLSVSKSPPPPLVRSPSLTSPRKPSESSLLVSLPTTTTKDKETSEETNSESTTTQTVSRTPRPANPPALETVTESSLPSTPALGLSKFLVDPAKTPTNNDDNEKLKRETKSENPSSTSVNKIITESESDTGNKSDGKLSSRAPSRLQRRPTVGASTVKTNQEGAKDMTAEIETVVSVPQQVNPVGSVRLNKKQSTDTIRPPKKEKKKTKRSVTAPSNRRDIFEQKIIDTLEDADSSNSEETFVYESNPPEPPIRPRHSRTPSVTSMQSDPRRATISEQGNPRRSMKFGPNAHVYKELPAYSDGTVTESSTTQGSTRDGHPGGSSHTVHRGHVARMYPPVFSEEGVNPHHHQYHKPSYSGRQGHHVSTSRTSSRPASPKTTGVRNSSANGARNLPNGKRGSSKLTYEGDIEAEDDETTPLVNYPRTSHPKMHKRRTGTRQQQRQSNMFARFAGCLIASASLVFIIAAALGFIFMTTKPLEGLAVTNITDIIVSKQEMMFNLIVESINPNALSISIAQTDLNIFAKSPYVGDGKPDKDDGTNPDDDQNDEDGWLGDWRRFRHGSTTSRRRRARAEATSRRAPHKGGIDEGNGTDDDDDDDPSSDAQTMLLGRIFNFDSPLVFDGSPLRHQRSLSTGELRLAKPGNKTEEGGTERWERVLLHPFELIVRGVLKYQLPLSGRVRAAAVSASVIVHPKDLPKDLREL